MSREGIIPKKLTYASDPAVVLLQFCAETVRRAKTRVASVMRDDLMRDIAQVASVLGQARGGDEAADEDEGCSYK